MKYCYAIFLVIILTSCSSPFLFNIQGYEVLEEDLDTVWKDVSSYTYQKDSDNYYKSPIEFQRDGGGDCEDFCIYMIYHLGPEASIVANSNHAVVLYKGKFIDPQVYGLYLDSFTIVDSMSYYELMKYCTQGGTKSIY